jgi:ferredoxin
VTYVIAEPCIGQEESSCVDVCPVDCIHPTPDEPGYAEATQLYIEPEECIDCAACTEACPVDAVYAEAQLRRNGRRSSPSTPSTTGSGHIIRSGCSSRPRRAAMKLAASAP